jgi:hypothetical protein
MEFARSSELAVLENEGERARTLEPAEQVVVCILKGILQHRGEMGRAEQGSVLPCPTSAPLLPASRQVHQVYVGRVEYITE